METKALRFQKNRQKRKSLFFSAVLRVIVFVFIIIGCNFIFVQMQQNQNRLTDVSYILAIETYTPEKSAVVQAVVLQESAETDVFARTRKDPDRNIDFKGLIAANSDIYAWINVPGTNIDYPVLSCGDNEYYLSHNAFNEESRTGAIFSDMSNSIGFKDPVTVLYGHRMNDGSMFAGLHKFEEISFFNQNRTIKVYTMNGEWDYTIFAAYKTDNTNILYGKDYTDLQQYQLYLDSLQVIPDTNANMSGLIPTADEYILTLSTCMKDDENSRYVVQAVLR